MLPRKVAFWAGEKPNTVTRKVTNKTIAAAYVDTTASCRRARKAALLVMAPRNIVASAVEPSPQLPVAAPRPADGRLVLIGESGCGVDRGRAPASGGERPERRCVALAPRG
jgi:hypothetical protein